ncbi:MAG TPA: hypothetical protein VK675_02235 [Candidatus Paceibacterota bacterium]|nr:hypothetical protein [Candidatus Paceibacterota bacterium]
MKLSKMTILIVAILAVIAIGIGLYFSAFKTTFKIVSTKTYTAPDGSFSFQYPEFEGWTAYMNQDPYSIWFNAPFESFIAPRIKITISYQPVPIAHPDKWPVNPQNITYIMSPDYSLSFFGSSEEKVKIISIELPMPPPGGEQYNFSARKMAEMIIESFVFKSEHVYVHSELGDALLGTSWILLDPEGNETDLELDFRDTKRNDPQGVYYDYHDYLHHRPGYSAGYWSVRGDTIEVFEDPSYGLHTIYSKASIEGDILYTTEDTDGGIRRTFKKINHDRPSPR